MDSSHNCFFAYYYIIKNSIIKNSIIKNNSPKNSSVYNRTVKLRY